MAAAFVIKINNTEEADIDARVYAPTQNNL